MPDARKKPRPNIWILATSNVDSWLHTPRTIVMLIAAVLLCMVETQKLFRLYTIDGYSLHLVESVFLLAYTGFNILMSSMMFLVTISELPMQISFQYYSLVRVTRRKWINSQVLYCLSMVVMFLLLLTACSFAFCLGKATWKIGCSSRCLYFSFRLSGTFLFSLRGTSHGTSSGGWDVVYIVNVYSYDEPVWCRKAWANDFGLCTYHRLYQHSKQPISFTHAVRYPFAD